MSVKRLNKILDVMKLSTFSLILIILLSTVSCTISRTAVGNYSNIDCKSKVYKKDKDRYLFWNLVTLREIEKTIKIADYEKVVRRNTFDTVVFFGTAGIMSFYTVTIRVKDCGELEPAVIQE
jgi:hypothetical protein